MAQHNRVAAQTAPRRLAGFAGASHRQTHSRPMSGCARVRDGHQAAELLGVITHAIMARQRDRSSPTARRTTAETIALTVVYSASSGSAVPNVKMHSRCWGPRGRHRCRCLRRPGPAWSAGLTPHVLRHSFASLAGHKMHSITHRYVHSPAPCCGGSRCRGECHPAGRVGQRPTCGPTLADSNTWISFNFPTCPTCPTKLAGGGQRTRVPVLPQSPAFTGRRSLSIPR